MGYITLDTHYLDGLINKDDLESYEREANRKLEPLLRSYHPDKENVLGWTDINELQQEELLSKIESKAKEVREDGEVFIIVGVGGSNQGARAAIEALRVDNKPQILYLGNNLSPKYIGKILEEIQGKSIYINIIAKNFETLEPGLGFRMIRNYMENCYSKEEMAKRIIATGTIGEKLNELSKQQGYTFLPFPQNIGGRYSVLSSVGLFPIAISGISIREVLRGARAIKEYMEPLSLLKNPAFKYAVIRNYLYKNKKCIEVMGYFYPELMYFGKWWVQLFGESEGKEGKGLFVSDCSYSEDLHAMGQFIQQGSPILFETFLNVEEIREDLKVPLSQVEDGFDYLNNKYIRDINKASYTATVQAHSEGGVPVCIVNIPELTAYYIGQLFYFFEIGCYNSAVLLGVNPFNQPGVEGYKNKMFDILKN